MREERSRLREERQVVALIALAGGLEAVSTVLEGLAEDLDAAVVVLIHQAPDRENELVPLLQRRSRLPVLAAQDDAPLAAGTVVVAPPGKHTLVTSGRRIALIVSGASPPSRPSADLLLATLATACGPLATAVVLSGGGHDGATGATAIHRLGGTVIASSEVFRRGDVRGVKRSAVRLVIIGLTSWYYRPYDGGGFCACVGAAARCSGADAPEGGGAGVDPG